MKTLYSVLLFISIFSSQLFANPADMKKEQRLSGLWEYKSISHKGGKLAPNQGYFLFHNGKFIQHAIDTRVSHMEKVGQAHVGTYSIENGISYFDVELGIIFSPDQEQKMNVRRKGRNHASILLDNNTLKLSFDENSVQLLEKIGNGKVEIDAYENGYLAFSEDRFILIYLNGDSYLSASGIFTKLEDALELHTDFMITVMDNQVTYSDNVDLQLGSDKEQLYLPEGGILQLKSIR
ncbi:MAG: hypothetical protein HN764_15715 [Gammaproteobacteria bacterium]|jgi:hypothetical protein|nr:hypothetical protein [Gammaproteobacteria bacterium]